MMLENNDQLRERVLKRKAREILKMTGQEVPIPTKNNGQESPMPTFQGKPQ